MPKRKIFEELKAALEAALAYERGEQISLRTTLIPGPAKKTEAKS